MSDACSLRREDYRLVKAYLVNGLRKPKPVTLPVPAKPIAEMDAGEYEKHRASTLRALRLRRP